MLKEDFLNMFARCLEEKDIWIDEKDRYSGKLCVRKPNGEIIRLFFDKYVD